MKLSEIAVLFLFAVVVMAAIEFIPGLQALLTLLGMPGFL